MARLPQILTDDYRKYEDNPELINIIAWSLYEQMLLGELKDDAVLKLTREAAEKAAANADKASKAAILDAAAHLQHLAGDLDAALKTQTEAVAAAGPELKARLQEFLDDLKKERQRRAHARNFVRSHPMMLPKLGGRAVLNSGFAAIWNMEESQDTLPNFVWGSRQLAFSGAAGGGRLPKQAGL